MIFESERKKWRNSAVVQKKVRFEKNQGLQHRGGGRWKLELFSYVIIKAVLFLIKFKLFLVFKVQV